MDNESWSFGQIWRLFGNYRVGPEKVARVLSMAQIQKLIQEPNAERIYHHRSCWKRLRPAPIHSCASLIILRYTRCNTVIYTVYESNPQTIQELKDKSATQLQTSKSLCYIWYTSQWLEVCSCVLMQEASAFNIFYDGVSFQHLVTVLISVFTLCYGPGLLFRGPLCRITTGL